MVTMKRTLAALAVGLLSGAYVGLAYAFGVAGAFAALVELFGIVFTVGGLLFVAVLAWILVTSGREDDVDDIEAARKAYSNGEIPLSELERRMDVALDPEAQRLRALVEDVPGVGPETSAALAGEFMSVDAIEEASRADLERVYGVGPNTAHAIYRRFTYDSPHDRPAASTPEEAGVERELDE